MPVGSHKDAFKAHQIVKKLIGSNPTRVLGQMAADILLDFVKNQRQICSGQPPEKLPPDRRDYEADKLDAAILAVDSLCGKCEESHDNACFVNQARRALIAAKTGVDLGALFDGKKKIEELLDMAARLASVPTDKAACDADPVPSAAPSQDDIDELRRQMAQLREKEIFRATLIDEIVTTIEAVSEGNFAAEMPVHEDEQLAKLAKAFNIMRKTIKETLDHLDHLVAERSRELRMIMGNVPSGILSIDEQGRINTEHSRSVLTILGLNDVRGRDFLDAIGLTRRRASERSKLQEFINVFRLAPIPEKDLAGLNPYPELELPARDGHPATWIALSYHLMPQGEGKPNHILVIIEDITQQKELARMAERTERENTHLRAIAEDPDLFRDFLLDMRRTLAETTAILQRLTAVPDDRRLVNEAYRGVHTIKGVAGSMGLEGVVAIIGQLEEQLSELREGGMLTPELATATKDVLARLAAEAESMSLSAQKLLGEDPSEDGDIRLRVSLQALKQGEEKIRALKLDADVRQELLSMISGLKAVPARQALSRVLKMIPGLAQRLGKNVRVVLDGEHVPIDYEVAKELHSALLHVIRNALDHGIEPPEERTAREKPEQATLGIQIESMAGTLTVRVNDDGRGMDPETLKAAAVRKGLLSAAAAAVLSRNEALNLIFTPGFSTAESVTDVSGRGVGMDAVLAVIRDKLGGRITLESEQGRGTTVTMSLPCSRT